MLVNVPTTVNEMMQVSMNDNKEQKFEGGADQTPLRISTRLDRHSLTNNHKNAQTV